MASFSIESAAEWVGKLVLEEVQYLASVRDKIEELQSELEWMQCFLWDADRKQYSNAVIRKWISEIRDLAHHAEDTIETYILQISHKRETSYKGLIPWSDLKWVLCFWSDATKLYGIGNKIDSLTAKISRISMRLQTYGIKSSYDVNSKKIVSLDQRRTFSHTRDEVVGLEESVEDMAKKLSTRQERVIVIHGMGGVGKTTFAREIYYYLRSKKQFTHFAWGYVSQQLQVKNICKEILLQLIPEQQKEERKEVINGLISESQLTSKLNDVFRREKCLVVLDDIWHPEDWQCLSHAFPLDDHNICASKLLLTTRDSKLLPIHLQNKVDYFEVTPLNPEQSWDLFQKKAHFDSDNPTFKDPSMVELAKKMVNHCNGHPLAIVALGGVLATKRTNQEWQFVYEDLSSHQQGNELYSGVYEVLGMSYYDLPYHLKACFLLLGYFPKDIEIPAERIYHLWIAEGIVSLSQGQARGKRSLEDMAEVYLNELVQKGMVQVMSRDSGRILTCKLHDLMRDKCVDIAKEEKFVQLIEPEPEPEPKRSEKRKLRPNYDGLIKDNLRRLAILVDPHRVQECLLDPSKLGLLRSLLFFPTSKTKAKVESCEWIENIPKDFDLLRILDFTGFPMSGKLPSSVGSLIYLRYLSLKDTNIDELPISVGDLRSLLILDLRVRSKVTFLRLPNVLWKIKSLRLLYLPVQFNYDIEREEELRLDSWRELQIIDGLDLERVKVEGLQELTSLRRAGVRCRFKVKNLDILLKSSSINTMSLDILDQTLVENPNILSGCRFLHHLRIGDNRKVHLPRKVVEMLPHSLVVLEICYSQISEDSIPVLEKLPQLRTLRLIQCYQGEKLQFSDDSFPELTFLELRSLPNLTKWKNDKGAPKLNKIKILNCPIQ